MDSICTEIAAWPVITKRLRGTGKLRRRRKQTSLCLHTDKCGDSEFKTVRHALVACTGLYTWS